MSGRPRHFIDLAGMPAGEIRRLLRLAESAEPADPTALAGHTVATLFFEDSTRTRTSFTLAARRLGADVIDLASTNSSLSKGESIADTAKTIEAMGISAMVIRSSRAGTCELIAQHVGCSVINAGDGRHQHPTQGLLDAYTACKALDPFSPNPFDLTGKTVVIVGDLASSRVFRSDVAAFGSLGATVVGVGSSTLAPRSLEALGCRIERDLDAVLPEADAVQALRIQFERHGGTAVASRREYRARFGLTIGRALRMKPGSVVMHPGPMNRGLEIDEAVCEGGPDLPRPLILEQVAAGVSVRIALLRDLLSPAGGSAEPVNAPEPAGVAS